MRIATLTLLALVPAALTTQSCSRAQANVQTLVSSDCGQTWELIKPGETIPSQVGMCAMKTSLPASPMTGASEFKTSFAKNVKAKISLDYEYMIVDGLKFIEGAKYLGKTNSDADNVSTGDGRFEAAENTIIDKRMKDAARSLLEDIDIVDFDQSEFEDKLLDTVNAVLEPRGVIINYLSFVPEPDIQTEQAIDVATAMRIYDSKDMRELGSAVIAAKAGATTVTMNAAPAK